MKGDKIKRKIIIKKIMNSLGQEVEEGNKGLVDGEIVVFKMHLVLAFVLRFILIVYANFHDSYFNVPYTDIDYNVYTDAARFLTQGESPYTRHTYRYTPFLALILTPNIFIHKDFGKLLFSFVDIIIGILIKYLLERKYCSKKLCNISLLLWLYNPITIVISTRGNSDSLAILLVLLTLYFIEKNSTFTTGLIHGISIHYRLYPIVFSLSIYLTFKNNNNLLPNKNQLKLITGCILTLITFTGISYYFYGNKFLYESFIYHLIRKDSRHNFSIYFYMIYLTIGQTIQYCDIIQRLVTILIPIILLISLSFKYYQKIDLAFAMLTQTIIIVTYNSVITSQYFYWYLSILPLCLPYINIKLKKLIVLIGFWIISQGLWLLNAYYLEFLGLNTFYFIWISSLIFFSTNIIILIQLIEHYNNKIVLKKKK